MILNNFCITTIQVNELCNQRSIVWHGQDAFKVRPNNFLLPTLYTRGPLIESLVIRESSFFKLIFKNPPQFL